MTITESPEVDHDLDELTSLALSADPDRRVDDDAVSFYELFGEQDSGLLPDWYMPGPSAGASQLTGWRRVVAFAIVLAFLAIVASGLCSTYGFIVVA